MTTLDAMRTEIMEDTERSGDAAAITSKIRAAIRHYQPTRFWFNESRSVTFQTVAGTDLYAFATIGAEFYRVDGLFLTAAPNDVRELEAVAYDRLERQAESDTATGQPGRWAYIERAIRLWRNPDAVYSVRIDGHIKAEAPAADDEMGNVWMNEAYDLIMCRAKAELYAHRWEDPNTAAMMQVAEREALRTLQAATHDKVASGFLAATEF